jgi:hypothetical protein
MISKRERYLVVLVVAIIGGYGLFLAVRGLFLGPLEAQVAQISSLTNEISLKEKRVDEIAKASARVAEWEKVSLPGDERDAQSLYNDYLLKLLRDCHFDELTVSPEKTQRVKSLTIIPFIIRGRVTLENLTDFLYRFHAYEPKVLHQVRSLTIGRTDTKSKNLTVTLIVAALALDNAPHRGPLIPEGEDLKKLEIDGVPIQTYEAIAKRNIFEPFREPPKSEPEKPQVDAAKFVVFSGCVQAGEEPEAWLYDRLNNKNEFLRAGDDLAIAGIKAKIVSVAASSMILHMDDKEWSLKLGKNLRELKETGRPVAKTEKSEPKGPDEAKGEATGESSKASDEKVDKIEATVPAKKEAADPGHEVTKADGAS